jgi:hypothetical protein
MKILYEARRDGNVMHANVVTRSRHCQRVNQQTLLFFNIEYQTCYKGAKSSKIHTSYNHWAYSHIVAWITPKGRHDDQPWPVDAPVTLEHALASFI